MLTPRVYEPTKGELIYHYCSAASFLEVATTKKMRFSDLFSMNDFLEMHWGYSIWEKAASELLEEVGRDFLDEIDKIVSASGIRGLLVAACFSLDGDVLSQWRAYTDDGQGYAIGFDAEAMLGLPIRPLRVLYDDNQQVRELMAVIRAIREVEKTEKKKFGEDFFTTCGVLAFDLASFKNPAFTEEKEVRLTHLLRFEKSNDFLKLVDDGGHAFGKTTKGQPVQFLMRGGSPVTFIDLDFTNRGKVNPIKEVVVGPKNDVRSTAVSAFLETVGIGSVKISRSKASYR